MIWFIVVFEGYYVSEVSGAYLTCKLFFYKCKVTLHFVTVMIAKMSLHMKCLSHCSQVAFMIRFIVVFQGYYVSEVFGAYLTCKIGS